LSHGQLSYIIKLWQKQKKEQSTSKSKVTLIAAKAKK
jgi:hypothetical protein